MYQVVNEIRQYVRLFYDTIR